MKIPNISALSAIGTRTFGRSALIVRKYSPEILTTVGILGVVASGVMASKATLKLEGVVDETNQGLEAVKSKLEEEHADNYSSTEHKRDLAKVYIHSALDVAKLYGPSVTLGLSSIGCIVAAHGIMRKRNVALVAAYNVLEKTFDGYRKRVQEVIGEDKEREVYHGLRQEEVTDSEGKKQTVVHADPNGLSQYARFFDELSPNWDKTPEYNLLFLKCQQNYANDLLHSRGHVFLNEVYDMLGIERSQAGSVVGWVRGEGDNFVDFGIYDPKNLKAREFVNGVEASILLDFNVSGLIYDKI